MEEETKIIPNPYGANETVSDPREQVMWDTYVEALNNGKENAYQAAIDAGYSESSALNVTTRDWFKERLGKLRRKEMLSDAEKLLRKTLKFDTVDVKTGEIKTDLLRIQSDVAKHVTKTLGKHVGYSERTEHTGVDGKDLIPPSASAIALAQQLNEFNKRNNRQLGSNGADTDVVDTETLD